jgi:hypothetical protein
MKNWINKHLRKGKCVHVMVYDLPRRVKSYYLIPVDNIVSIPGHRWKLNELKVYLFKGIPSYVLSTKDAEPIDPLELDKHIESSETFDIAIGQTVAREIFNAMKSSFNSAMLSLILMFVLTIGLVVIAYLGSEMIASLQADLDAIKNVIGIGG